MTRDDIKRKLGDDATEEQITNMLNLFHENNKEKQNKINEYEAKLNDMSDYSSLKAKIEEIEKANMTREEQIALKEKNADVKLEKATKLLNTTIAKQILKDYDLSDNTIDLLVNSDENITVQNANDLKTQLDAMKENTAKVTRESLTNVDLKPSMSNVNQNEGVMTFEKFSMLSAEEQNKFIEEHPQEFENL